MSGVVWYKMNSEMSGYKGWSDSPGIDRQSSELLRNNLLVVPLKLDFPIPLWKIFMIFKCPRLEKKFDTVGVPTVYIKGETKRG